MDLCAADDPGVHRGIQILHGKESKTIHIPKPTSSSGSSKRRTPSPKDRTRHRQPSSDGPEGLDLARRRILVVKPGDAVESSSKADEREQTSAVDAAAISKVIVVDHGEHQRDAVRRLFEAQVLIQSQNVQLQEKDVEIAELQKRVIRAERTGSKVDVERQDALDAATIAQEAQQASVTHIKKNGKHHHHTSVIDKKVPFWLRNDEQMRQDLDTIRQVILREYMSEGHLDAASLLEHMWQLAYASILRWGTEPDEEIVKQNEAIEAKLRKVQKDALQETSMLRQSQKALEKKYKELQHRSREAIEKLKAELRKYRHIFNEMGHTQQMLGGGAAAHHQSVGVGSPTVTGSADAGQHHAIGGGGVAHPGFAAQLGGGLPHSQMQPHLQQQQHGQPSHHQAYLPHPGAPHQQWQQNLHHQAGQVADGAHPRGSMTMMPVHEDHACAAGVPTLPQGSMAVPGAVMHQHMGGPCGAPPAGALHPSGMPQQQGGLLQPCGMQPMGMQHACSSPVGVGLQHAGPGSPGTTGFAGVGIGGAVGGGALMVGAPPAASRAVSNPAAPTTGAGACSQAHFASTAPPGSMAIQQMHAAAAAGGGGVSPMSMPGGLQSPMACHSTAGGIGIAVSQPPDGYAPGSTMHPSVFSSTAGAGSTAGGGSNLALPGQSFDPFMGTSLSQTSLGGAFGNMTSPGSSARNLEDSLDDINIDDMDLEEMDHELFEPLNTFDSDLRELMISTVNEKVRRILSMDPNKFKNGKLPFGLKPDKIDPATYDRARYLEGEVESLKTELEEVKYELEEANNKLDAQKLRLEGMKAKQFSDGQELQKQLSNRRLDPAMDDASPGGKSRKELQVEANQQAQARIKDLVAAVKDLEEQLEAKDKELKAARNEVQSLANTKSSFGGEAPRKTEVDRRAPQAQPKATQPQASGSQPAAPSAPPDAKQSPPPAQVKESVDLAHKHEALLNKVLGFMSSKDGEEQSPKAKQVARRITVHMQERGSSPAAADLEKTLPMYEEWAREVMKGTPEAPAPAFEAAAPGKRRQKTMTKSFADTGSGFQAIDDEEEDLVQARAEIKSLREKNTGQKEEIARLLLTIDELRARLDKVCNLAGEAGPEMRDQVVNVMAAAGLQEIMEASSGPKLRAVFERLYQDAVQRMERLRLILQRRVVANKAYSAARTVQQSQAPIKTIDGGSLVEPDLARFSETASATLKGMFYHYEHLFKRVSDYAEAQGLEDSNFGANKFTLAELLEANDGKLPADLPSKPSKERTGNVPHRLGDGNHSRAGAVPEQLEHGRTFWNTPGSGSAPKSPTKARSEHLADPQPTPFSSYVAALREARGDLKPEDWPRLGRDGSRKALAKTDGLKIPPAPKSIAQLCEKGSGLHASRSLPALPSKDRSALPATGADVGMRSPKGHDTIRLA